jgi:hypothetical protein
LKHIRNLNKDKTRYLLRERRVMKRTCNGCKAFVDVQGSEEFRCTLGYKMDVGKPLEECPKPKNYAELIYCQGKTTRAFKT